LLPYIYDSAWDLHLGLGIVSSSWTSGAVLWTALHSVIKHFKKFQFFWSQSVKICPQKMLTWKCPLWIKSWRVLWFQGGVSYQVTISNCGFSSKRIAISAQFFIIKLHLCECFEMTCIRRLTFKGPEVCRVKVRVFVVAMMIAFKITLFML
jgi:hypothetical protein